MLFYWKFLHLFPIYFSNKRHRKLVFLFTLLALCWTGSELLFASQVLLGFMCVLSASFLWTCAHGPSCLTVTFSFQLLCPPCDLYLRTSTQFSVLPSSLSCPVKSSSLLLINQGLLGSILYRTLANIVPQDYIAVWTGHRTQLLNT